MNEGSWTPDSPFWDRWEAHYRELGIDDEYCADGIADEERFRKAPVRALFVLKEPNQWKRAHLRDQLKKGPEGLAWHNLARWAAGALYRCPYERLSDYTPTVLSEIAAINLKKRTGGPTADAAVINAFAYRDRLLLREQVRSIAPDLVVACGRSVFSGLVWLLGLETDQDRPAERLARSPEYETLVIPWKHPAARARKESLYEAFLRRLPQS